VLLQAEKVPGAHGKMYILDMGKTLRENLMGKRIVEYPILHVAIKGFYGAEPIEDITKGDKSKSKMESLLISSYSLQGKEEQEMSSEGEDETPKQKDANQSEEDALDDALDYLEGDKVKDVLSSLYKMAEQGNS